MGNVKTAQNDADYFLLASDYLDQSEECKGAV